MPRPALALVLAWCLAATASAGVVLTGEVRSEGAQVLYAPPSVNNSMVTLQYYVDDGRQVQRGDPVLRIDASQAATQLQNLEDQIEKARAKAAKEQADLELAEIDAQIALLNAEAAEASAAVDAAIPAELIPAIDYDRYQGTWTSSRRSTALAQKALADARAALVRNRNDGMLEVGKLELQLAFNQDQVDTATVYAEIDGTVVHDFMTVSFNGQPIGRYEQGSNAMTGMRVGEVVPAASRYSVQAWVLASDRDGLREGQPVELSFDALPGVRLPGTVTGIAAAAEAKPEWGEGRYYQVAVAAHERIAELPLLPGMSVRVATADEPVAVQTAIAVAPASTLRATGEIYARDSVSVITPLLDRVWRYDITTMVPDGDHVEEGKPVVIFAGGNIAQELPASRSKLQEAERALEKLKLDLADNAREVDLALARARADTDKADRKAEQPPDYVPGVEYKKLVIDRDRARQVLELTTRRTSVAGRDRDAQLRQAEVDVDIARHEVERLTRSLAELTLPAPRSGIVLHRSDWDGEKYDVGVQVFRGTTVADIPDMRTLAVQASLPEHEYSRVAPGQRVTVTLAGGIARQLRGHVESIGRSIHSMSRAEPDPVIDLDISLDPDDLDGLKPGQQVQVTIHPAEPEART